MQDRYKRLGKNTILVFMGKAGSSLVGLLMLPFYTHWLSTDEYGVTDLISTYSGILMCFISCCVADSIFVFPKDVDEYGKKKYYSSGYLFVLVNTILIAIILLFIQRIGLKYGLGGAFVGRIWFVLAFSVSHFFQQYSQSFTRSIDKMQVYSITGIVYTVFLAILSFLLLPRFGLEGYLYAMVASSVLAAVFSVVASGSYKYLSVHAFDKISLWDLLKYGIPLIPNSIMWWLVNGFNRPIMEANLGLDALGIYAVANKFPYLLSTLVGIFGTAWGITMLEEFGKPDFNGFFNRTIRILYFVMIVGACLIAASSKLIIYIFADVAYFSGTIGGVFMAEKKSKYFFYSSIWGAGASAAATIICVKLWGLQGAAIAVAFSFFVMVAVRLKYAWKHINEMKIWWYVIMTLLYILFFVVVLLDAPLFINIPIYLIILAAISIVGKNEIHPVLQVIYKKIKKL